MSQEARQEGAASNRGSLLWARKCVEDFEGRAATAVTVHLEHLLWMQDRQKSLLLSRSLYQQKVATCSCFRADDKVFEMKTIAFRKRYILPLKTPSEKIPWLDILSWGSLTCLCNSRVVCSMYCLSKGEIICMKKINV